MVITPSHLSWGSGRAISSEVRQTSLHISRRLHPVKFSLQQLHTYLFVRSIWINYNHVSEHTLILPTLFVLELPHIIHSHNSLKFIEILFSDKLKVKSAIIRYSSTLSMWGSVTSLKTFVYKGTCMWSTLRYPKLLGTASGYNERQTSNVFDDSSLFLDA